MDTSIPPRPGGAVRPIAYRIHGAWLCAGRCMTYAAFQRTSVLLRDRTGDLRVAYSRADLDAGDDIVRCDNCEDPIQTQEAAHSTDTDEALEKVLFALNATITEPDTCWYVVFDTPTPTEQICGVRERVALVRLTDATAEANGLLA